MFYIWEAAVADFYGVPVEDFAQFVLLWEVLVDQGEEDFGDIGGYIAVEGRIKPCDFAFSFFELTAGEQTTKLHLRCTKYPMPSGNNFVF